MEPAKSGGGTRYLAELSLHDGDWRQENHTRPRTKSSLRVQALSFLAPAFRGTLGSQAGLTSRAGEAALASLESRLSHSLLAREETLGPPMSAAELKWLRKHRSKSARRWNLLTNWRPEVLRYVA